MYTSTGAVARLFRWAWRAVGRGLLAGPITDDYSLSHSTVKQRTISADMPYTRVPMPCRNVTRTTETMAMIPESYDDSDYNEAATTREVT